MKTAFKEYEEYIAALGRTGQLPDFLPAFFGFVETNFGIGMVVERIDDADGYLAPTLHKYIEAHGLSEKLLEQAHGIVDALAAAGIVCFDLTARNIVVGVDEEGHNKLMLVDGISENTFFKIKTYFRPVFKKWLEKKRGELISDMQKIAAVR